MKKFVKHLAVTTPNQTGLSRRHQHFQDWLSVGLEPQYLFASLPKVTSGRQPLKSNQLYLAQLSCTQTHRLAWKDFLSSDYAYCLITEDDACISDYDFFKELDAFIQQSIQSESPMIVQLGTVVFSRPSLLKIMRATFNLFRIIRLLKFDFKPSSVYTDNFSYGTHCYLLNRAMGEVLCELDDAGYVGLDAHLMAFLNHSLGKDVCQTFRKLVPASFQRREDSNIPTNQEYFGRRKKKPTYWEIIASFANSNGSFTHIG